MCSLYRLKTQFISYYHINANNASSFSREKRRTVQEKELEERQKLKRQRRDLEQLSQIQVEIEEEIGQQELRNLRRKVSTISH